MVYFYMDRFIMLSMNYTYLTGKRIILLGKTRALNIKEFETFLKQHNLDLVSTFTQVPDIVIEGRLMNPYEQEWAVQWYELGNVEFIPLEHIERWLCESIQPQRVLMSLKLSKDQERLVDFLKNPYILDDFFLKLLELYDWKNEGLFDSDQNRDVTAAIIGRFYKDLERNHNVQYAMSGLAHLIEKYGDEILIDAISKLEPIKKALKANNDPSLNGILDAIALHPDTNPTVLNQLLSHRAMLLASREPLILEKELLALSDIRIDEKLASNATLSEEGFAYLLKHQSQLLAKYIKLTESRFKDLYPDMVHYLASNISLTASMQKVLVEGKIEAVLRELASNPSLEENLKIQLLEEESLYPYLAKNPSLSSEEIEKICDFTKSDILDALASNLSTPIDILYQLSLDRRFERKVKMNPAFGHYIQTHNIGWY